MAEGVDGLLRDKTHPLGVAPLAPTVMDEGVALTLEPPRPRGHALDSARDGEGGRHRKRGKFPGGLGASHPNEGW